MSARTLRRLVVVVCVGGIGTMIAGSVADSTGVALTAGLVTVVAVVCLMAVTAVAGPGPGPGGDEALGADIEARVARLVRAGADEEAVRSLVRQAVRLGRGGAG